MKRPEFTRAAAVRALQRAVATASPDRRPETEIERIRSKPAEQDPHKRLILLTARLYQGHAIDSRYIRERFGVGRHTAHRDMHVLEATLPLHATPWVRDTERGQNIGRRLRLPPEHR